MQHKPSHYDVIILGAGAAGLMCAFTAAQRGRRVLVLEKANKVGKKILMSGGGRCNFTNYFVTADNFLSANPHFCKSALSRYTQWDFIAMVERHGIEYEERKHSQLFCKHSAKDILTMLLQECDNAGVEIKTHCDIHSVAMIDAIEQAEMGVSTTEIANFRVNFNHSANDTILVSESLVVATGALSIPTLGGSSMGYDIARQFSLTLTARQAGLVPFMFSDATKPLCERLSGVSLPVTISCNQQSFTDSILFTHRGISGPGALQISNYWRPGDTISINLLPELESIDYLLQAKQQQGKSLLRSLLNGALPKALVIELQSLLWSELAESPLADFSDKKLIAIGKVLAQWPLKPSATEGYRTAEVTLGGVDTDGISSKTMAAKQYPGLFFIGEVLDVTGHLGGFNFQWAWSSGYSAGQFA
ncbi:MAG: NAD(P)/FAD-dependent oxidoreductase [Halioglobus sp.]